MRHPVLLSAVDKSVLLRRVREGTLSPDAAISALRGLSGLADAGPDAGSPWEDRFRTDLSGLVGQLLRRPGSEIDVDVPVADMGLDSLSATEFNNRVRARWGVSLQATAFFECRTVRDFQNYLVRSHGESIRASYGGSSRGAPAEDATPSAPRTGPTSGARAKADPLRATLERLWSRAESELANSIPIRESATLDRLLIERRNRPAIEVCYAGRGEPVLLLGGLMNPEGIWHRQIDALALSHRVVVFNMPGCGRSGMDTHRLSMASIVEDLVVALDTLHLHEALPVVGFSFGGLVAQSLALEHPDRVARLALVNTTACTRPRSDDVQILKSELDRCPEVIAINGDIDLEQAAAYREVSRHFDRRQALPSLRMPALVMSAREDRFVGEDQSRELAGLLALARHVEIADAGHFSIVTHWDAVNRALLDFLRPDATTLAPATEERLQA